MQTVGRAKGFLFSTQWEEPFGLAVAEAMAAGTPVLAYPRGSMPELVKDGESGYLISTEKGMVEAIHRIESLDRRRCREWVQENFSVEQMVDDPSPGLFLPIASEPSGYSGHSTTTPARLRLI
jgi:glycosyltransferase involved in cell wall biosynthesis